jgi:UDP-N-acetylmuramoyl-L-alanyl-D-glutamate--2,6-diaminopimelate ligase
MHWEEILLAVPVEARSGANPVLIGVEYDSRRVQPGALFVAMRGTATDGNQFIPDALAKGAAAILTDSSTRFAELNRTHPRLAVAQVQHGRRALAMVSANFFRHPERALHLTGVTGTNGKTTTAFLLESRLRSAQRHCVLSGTIENHLPGKTLPAPHTTPESRDLFDLLAQGVALGASEAVMEVSSHALDQGRVWGLRYDAAIFTNLTQDHLDYHGDMESYFQAKVKLFTGEGTGTAPPRVAIVHTADAYGQRIARMAEQSGAQVIEYALDHDAYHAANIVYAASGTRFDLILPGATLPVQSQLIGEVNVLNLLAAVAAAQARGLTLEQMQRGIAQLTPVPGRFQPVDCGQPFTVVVDYAHTDDALRNLTRLARTQAKKCGGRVLTLFGCGGDRDRAKRPKMGRAAGEGSDFTIVTSDNPRSEDPLRIIEEILPGLQAAQAEYSIEPDRAAAIAQILALARAGDVVLLAGKGHEKMQIFADRTIPFDDAEVARAALQARTAER